MAEFQVSKSSDDKFFWELRGNNHETLCVSETYNSKQSALDTIKVVQREAADATLTDKTK